MAATPRDEPSWIQCAQNFANQIELRYERTSRLADLDDAINVARDALDTVEQDLDDDPLTWLVYLGEKIRRRHDRLERAEDLSEAIKANRRALGLTPEDDNSTRASVLRSLGNCLESRHDQTGNADDLQEPISMAERALGLMEEDDPNWAAANSNLANKLYAKYSLLGHLGDLNEAIRLDTLEKDADPSDNEIPGYLANLGNKFAARFERLGDPDDLEKAIRFGFQAIEMTSEDDESWSSYANNFAVTLEQGWNRTGEMQYLEKALHWGEKIVKHMSDEDPRKPGCLSNLGNRLSLWHERTGDRAELEEAVQVTKRALELTPDGHFDRALYLRNLGTRYESRYERTHSLKDLEEAVQATRQAADILPERHEEYAPTLAELANKLDSLYEHAKNLSHLNEAIRTAKLACEVGPADHPDRGGWFNTLVITLTTLYEETGSLDDLEEAIRVFREAVRASPDCHPTGPMTWINLASTLETRFEKTKQVADLEEAIEYFLRASKAPEASPLNRAQAGRSASRLLHGQGKLRRAIETVEQVFLLPFICGRYLSREDQQHAVVQISGLAADACSLYVKSGAIAKAVSRLEFGRGIIVGYLIDNRLGLSTLKADSPELAARYEKLHSAATRPPDDSSSTTAQRRVLEERRRAVSEVEECVRQIRDIPGHERFLLRPEFEELAKEAAQGPIVMVNVTDISADATILAHHQVKALPLPGISPDVSPPQFRQQFDQYVSGRRGDYKPKRDIEAEEDSEESYRNTGGQLSWLWDCCVGPVLACLKEMGVVRDGEVPRVWWIGSGVASSFPFHAAGNASVEGEDALGKIISSYTPTIKALAYSRSCVSAREKAEQTEKPSVLVVNMPSTPGQKSLPGADREMESIGKVCHKACSVKELRLPNAAAVLEAIPHSTMVHFACHGVSDPSNPSGSHLLLQSNTPSGPVVDRLTASRISTVTTKGREWLAFLSACSTAEVRASRLEDEGLHLASSFLVAGFAHVIGSMWSVDDTVCARLAELFYRELIGNGLAVASVRNRDIAAGLQTAAVQVREEFGDASKWASFVHFGA